MPKVLPKKMKVKAQKLYLEGKTINEVYEELIKAYPKENIAKSTVYSWPAKNKWDKDLTKVDFAVKEKAKEQIIESEGQRMARLQKEHLDEYEEIRLKAKLELKGLEFNSGEGAAKTLDLGIQGQQKIMGGLVHLSFVQEILGVLVDEIEDKDLLGKISLRLKGIVQAQNNAK